MITLTEKHNALVRGHEKALMQRFDQLDRKGKQQLYKKNPLVKKLVDGNGGLKLRKLPGRTGRIISVGIHTAMIVWHGTQPNADGSEKSLSENGREAIDLAAGAIPVAGGVYDLYRARQ